MSPLVTIAPNVLAVNEGGRWLTLTLWRRAAELRDNDPRDRLCLRVWVGVMWRGLLREREWVLERAI